MPRTPGAPAPGCPEPGVWGKGWASPELGVREAGRQGKLCSVTSVLTENVPGGQQPENCRAKWEARKGIPRMARPSWSTARGDRRVCPLLQCSATEVEAESWGNLPVTSSSYLTTDGPLRPLPAVTGPWSWTRITLCQGRGEQDLRLALTGPTFCLGAGDTHWPEGWGPRTARPAAECPKITHTHTHTRYIYMCHVYTHTCTDHTCMPPTCMHTHTHTHWAAHLGRACTETLTYKDTWALKRHRDAEGLAPKPEPLGVAVLPLPGACTSQSSGHGGGGHGGGWEDAGGPLLSSWRGWASAWWRP